MRQDPLALSMILDLLRMVDQQYEDVLALVRTMELILRHGEQQELP
jgi:hypothetical protein